MPCSGKANASHCVLEETACHSAPSSPWYGARFHCKHDVSRRRAHTPPWKALRLQVSTGCCWPGLANSWVILVGILCELLEDTEDAHEGMSTGDPHQAGLGMRHCCPIPSPHTMQGWHQHPGIACVLENGEIHLLYGVMKLWGFSERGYLLLLIWYSSCRLNSSSLAS